MALDGRSPRRLTCPPSLGVQLRPAGQSLAWPRRRAMTTSTIRNAVAQLTPTRRAAESLGVPHRTLRDWIRKRLVPVYRPGGSKGRHYVVLDEVRLHIEATRRTA